MRSEEEIRADVVDYEAKKQRVESQMEEIGSGWPNFNHKWPRGLRQKLIEMDGGKPRCWWCWCQQPGLHIAHISIDTDSLEGWAYTKKNEYDPKYLVLLCPSCHAKHDKYGNSFEGSSPLSNAFTEAFKERFRVLNDKGEKP